jgi:hypothetical protein
LEISELFEVVGVGGNGSLSVEPEKLDFGIVKINFNKKVYAALTNNSNCKFFVQLRLKNNSQLE